MARPKSRRKVCSMPETRLFEPFEKEKAPTVVLSVDEYETIRLIDYQGFNQEETAKFMNIARTTVQQIYNGARKKLSISLVEGTALKIEGGDYDLCSGEEKFCACGGCRKHKAGLDGENIITEEKTMRIAVTYEYGLVFGHFGHTAQFKIYDVEDNEIVSSQVLDTNGSGHGALAGFLKANAVDVLICGGIGQGAKNALTENGIKLYAGVMGGADNAVKALLDGTLKYSSEANCDHHHEHGEGHDCASGGCGGDCHH